MEEKRMAIVLESLAETIQELRTDVQVLKYENNRLKEKNKELISQIEAYEAQEEYNA